MRIQLPSSWFLSTWIAILLVVTSATGGVQVGNAEGLSPGFSGRLGSSLGELIGDHFEIHEKLGIPKIERHYVGWPPRLVIPPGVTRFDEFNLFVNLPNEPWVCLKPKKKEAQVSLLIRRSNPAIDISLTAERVGLKANWTNSSLLALSQSKLKNSPKSVLVPGEWKIAANGIQGVSYEAFATLKKGKKAHFSIWVATYNGYNYSLSVSGEQKSKRAIHEAMRGFLRNIEPIKIVRPKTKPKAGKVAWASDEATTANPRMRRNRSRRRSR